MNRSLINMQAKGKYLHQIKMCRYKFGGVKKKNGEFFTQKVKKVHGFCRKVIY